MRKKSMRVSKTLLIMLLSVSMIITPLVGDSVLAYISGSGTTQIIYNEEREIARGVVLNNWHGKTADGAQKVGHTITFNPATSDAMILAAFGNSVSSRKTLSSTSSIVEQQQGVSVIGGINGDYYHLANGVPVGLLIQNGRLISCSTTNWRAIGFREDGSVFIGSPKFEMKAEINESVYPFNNFNKVQNDWGPYLYSSDFGSTTGTTVSSIEIIMDIREGQPASGKLITAVVSEIKNDTMSTPINPNQLVFSARNGKQGQYALSKFRVGDVVNISFYEPSGQWDNVRQAIGGDKVLIENGAIVSNLPAKNYDPTTAIGVKPNGDVVFYQVDGRSKTSQGASSVESARFLYDLGCIQAIELDGGGSSAMIARMPGYRSPGLLNTPSDGKERANSNGLILVSKQSVAIRDGMAQVYPEAQKLHIYPGKAYALSNSTIQYEALATDNEYFPTAIPLNLVWQSNAGVIDQTGKLLVNAAPGEYQVISAGGSAYGGTELVVLSNVTSLKPSKSSLSILPGESIDLDCEAFYNNIQVYSQDSSFSWTVEGNVGTITPDGVFTMAQGAAGNGKIKVSHGNVSAVIDVSATNTPDLLEDFDSNAGWGSSVVRAKSGQIAVVEDVGIAKSGSRFLKVDYDFTLDAGIEAGVAGVYAFRLDPNSKEQQGIQIDKNPTAVGMWVYGDNSKTWIRGKMKDGSGQVFDISFTPDYRTDTKTGGVDWTGWKYVEASIPSSRKGPFILETPIRVMCSRDEMRTKGTLYFDQIRAVYGDSSKDSMPPDAIISSPVDQSMHKVGKIPFAAELADLGSGVDLKSIQVFVDGVAVPVSVSGNGTVKISGELGGSLPLADGLHKLVVNYADTFENKGVSEVSFTVDTGAPQIIAYSSPAFYAEGNFTTTISVKNPKNLRKVFLALKYDPALVEPVDADSKAAGKQLVLDSWIKKAKIIKHSIDEKTGTIVLEIDNIINLSSSASSRLGTITFKGRSAAFEATNVRLDMGAMIVGKNKSGQRFSLPAMKVTMNSDLVLNATGISMGDATTFTLTDKAGNPVEGAGIYINDAKDAQWKTDKYGKVKVSTVTQFPVGTILSAVAKKGTLASNTLNITISEKNTGLTPQNLSLSLMPAPGDVSVNYITPKANSGTIVQYQEKSVFDGTFSGAMAIKGQEQELSLINLTKKVPVRVHSASLTNLKPGVSYIYRLGDDTGKFSSVYEFTTPKYDNPYSFVFLTDPQAAETASYQIFGDALNRAFEKAANPAFALLGGDLADRGGNKGQWDMMFSAASGVLSKLPVMAAPGNHEYYDDKSIVNFKALFTLPQNGPEGYKENSYYFETGDALFLVLDTQQSLKNQLKWLENTCKASDKKWKIVLMHRGIYSGFYDEAELRKAAAPVFDRAGIDLVLNGHDHTYLRTTMKDGKKVLPGKGTTYITGGSSAKKYYDAKSRAWTQVLYDTNNPVFTTFTVYSDKIAVKSSHIENGKTVDHDSFEIVK